jgi:hypothetical protein
MGGIHTMSVGSGGFDGVPTGARKKSPPWCVNTGPVALIFAAWLRSEVTKMCPAPADNARVEAKRLDVLDVAAGTRRM